MKMNSTKGGVRARLFASTLLAGLATVAAPLAVIAIASAVPTLASAQDYSSGSLVGTVKDSTGASVSDATVTVKSLDQGFTRTVTTDGSGQFRVPLIPIGGYSVAITKEGYQPTSDGNVRVGLGGSTAYTFNLVEAGASVSEVVVTATANPQLDFAATTKGLTVDMETLTKQAPIARSLTAVTQLAPGVVLGSAARVGTSPAAANFGAQPSVGGGSVAENAFYINGLNITNFDTYIGAAEVPFDFYKSIEVKTGGYPAEFGRATGGVINAVTKSGSNDFKFAVHGNFEFNSLREDAPDSYLVANHRGGRSEKSGTFEVSGPIIKDHLFFYVLNQQRDFSQQTAFKTLGQYTVDKSNDPFWGAKIDGYITDRQRVELTYFDTQKTINRSAYAYAAGPDTIGAALPSTVYRQGGVNYVARYTGTFTDWFTLSAAYGKNRDSNSTLPGDTTSPLVQDDSTGTVLTPSAQKQASIETRKTLREFYRVDGDFYFNLMGDHHVRMGYDHEKTTLNHASIRTGPGATGIGYIYHAGSDEDTFNVPEGTNYVEILTQRLGGAPVHGTNAAWYLQDAWDLTPNLSLQLGIRHDNFGLDNLLGEKVLDLKDNWGPRIGVTWDPVGEGKDKISASFGRYYIPPASNLSYRGADLGYSVFFFAPGYDPNTNPTANFSRTPGQVPVALGPQMTAATQGFPASDATLTSCPNNNIIAGATPGAQACTVSFGLGIAEPAYSKASQGIKASQEDEFTIGYERQFSALWKGGVNLTYRQLNRISEDTTLDPFVVDWCEANVSGTTLDACRTIYNNSWQYIVFNPGEDLTIKLRQPDPLVHDAATIAAAAALPKQLTFTKDELGFPKPKREYIALEFTFERAFDGKWGLRGSYTMSESKGNYEGTVLSDNQQQDAGSTVLYDFIGLTDNQYGLLPNHHAHQFKVFGNYAVTDNLMFGVNASVMSPKHQGCLGLHPSDDNSTGYGAASRYCNTFGTVVNPVTGAVTHPVIDPHVTVPRGSAMKTDWQTTLDLSVRYTVPETVMSLGGNLVLRADIFNLLNADAITSREERGETGGGAYTPNYRLPIAYQEPRYVRVGFDLNF